MYHHHQATDSNITDDSGLDCLTPSRDDDSADELAGQDVIQQPSRDVSNITVSSADSRSVTPASINTDSEFDDGTEGN